MHAADILIERFFCTRARSFYGTINLYFKIKSTPLRRKETITFIYIFFLFRSRNPHWRYVSSFYDRGCALFIAFLYNFSLERECKYQQRAYSQLYLFSEQVERAEWRDGCILHTYCKYNGNGSLRVYFLVLQYLHFAPGGGRLQ
jgi:hypothetical protein